MDPEQNHVEYLNQLESIQDDILLRRARCLLNVTTEPVFDFEHVDAISFCTVEELLC